MLWLEAVELFHLGSAAPVKNAAKPDDLISMTCMWWIVNFECRGVGKSHALSYNEIQRGIS